MPHTLKQGSTAILLVFLVGLSALLGCGFHSHGKAAESSTNVTLGQPGSNKTQATVTLWVEKKAYTYTNAFTITEYGVPSPHSVTVNIPYNGLSSPVRMEVHLTCFVPVDGTGSGRLQLQVSFDGYNGSTLVTVQVAPSGSASINPSLVQVGY